MSIIEMKYDVTVVREVYAPLITIRGNPQSDLASTISLDLSILEHHDGELVHTNPLVSIGETAGDFVQRTFDIGGVEITGMQVMQAVKQYVLDRYEEHTTNVNPV